MYLTHAALNTALGNCSCVAQPAGIAARVVVIRFAGKHNRCAHDSRVGSALPNNVMSRFLPHLLVLVFFAGAAPAEAQPGLSDARSGPDPELRKVLAIGDWWIPDRIIVLTSSTATIEQHILQRHRHNEQVLAALEED